MLDQTLWRQSARFSRINTEVFSCQLATTRGVTPESSAFQMSAPRSSSSCITSVCPFWLAMYSGVTPSSVVALLASAP